MGVIVKRTVRKCELYLKNKKKTIPWSHEKERQSRRLLAGSLFQTPIASWLQIFIGIG